MQQLSPYEYNAMAAIVLGDPEQEIMMAQLAKAECAARDYTGVGLYTDIVVDPTAPKLNASRRQIEDLPKHHALHPDLSSGAQVILWLKDGYITCLESYTSTGDWPKDESLFRIDTLAA